MGAVEAKFYGVASSILAVMRLTGQAISMSLVTLLLSIFTAEAIESNYVDIILHSFKYIFILFGFLCIIALFASLMRGKENVKE